MKPVQTERPEPGADPDAVAAYEDELNMAQDEAVTHFIEESHEPSLQRYQAGQATPEERLQALVTA